MREFSHFCNDLIIPKIIGNSEPISLIDSSTPTHARVLKTAQDIAYGLVFSDEFTQNGRLFSAGTFLLPSVTINFLSSISSDHDLIWEAASSIDSDAYDPSQINTRDGSLSVRLDNLHPQVEDRHRGQCTRERESGWSWTWGWRDWMGGYGAKKGSAVYLDRSLSGILKMKVPLCLSRGGLVEVGLGKKDYWSRSGLKREGAGKAEEDEDTLRRLIYVRILSPFVFISTYPSLYLLRSYSLILSVIL